MSECFDDLKPVMSTLQSVLAVAEATANLKNEATAGKKELSITLESKLLGISPTCYGCGDYIQNFMSIGIKVCRFNEIFYSLLELNLMLCLMDFCSFSCYFPDGFETDGDSDMNCSDISASNGKVSKELCGSPSPSSPQASVASTQEDSSLRVVRLPSGCSTPSQDPQRLHDEPSRLSALDGSNVALSPCTSETGLEKEEIIHMHTSCPLKSQEYHDVSNTVSSTVIVPQHQSSSASAPAVALARTGNPVTFKSLMSHPTRSSPYRLPVYSNVRFRARNMKKQQEQQVNLTKTFQQVNSINSTNTADADWINDEEMLFARFVGLRLKKMNSHYRSMVYFIKLSLFFFMSMSIYAIYDYGNKYKNSNTKTSSVFWIIVFFFLIKAI